jgi:hypothetical protein
MRISVNGYENPEVYEVITATAYVKHKSFIIEMKCPALQNEKDDSIYARCLLKKGDDEEIARLSKTYRGIATSLGLNGYANLCIGSMTCPLNEDWEILFGDEINDEDYHEAVAVRAGEEDGESSERTY